MRNTSFFKGFPNHLRRYRKARGLKQKDVAKILGFKSASMISRWEKGVCLPNTLNLLKLAALYRTMADALYVDLLRTIKGDLRQKEERVLKKAEAYVQPTDI
ncbi:MAG: helix-turn-helix transcriptional regulator [Halobacteria archaeon]